MAAILSHSCGCTPTRPCPEAKALHDDRRLFQVERHLETTLEIIYDRRLRASLGDISAAKVGRA